MLERKSLHVLRWRASQWRVSSCLYIFLRCLVVCRHVDSCRRYGHTLHPLRVVDVLHDKVLGAVKYAAMSGSPEYLLPSGDQGNEEPRIGCEPFRKQHPIVVTMTASLGSATVCAFHDHEKQLTTSDPLLLPVAAAAVGGVRCKILYRPDIPSPNSDMTSPSSSDNVLVSASLSYVHFQLSAFDSMSRDVRTESSVAFEITAEGQRAESDVNVMPTVNTPCVLLEAGAEKLDMKLVLSFSSHPPSGESACKSLEGQVSGEIRSVWGSLPVPQGKPRQSFSEMSNCDVVAMATAVCRQWIDRVERLKQSIEKLLVTGEERFAKVVSCLLTNSLLDSVTKPVSSAISIQCRSCLTTAPCIACRCAPLWYYPWLLFFTMPVPYSSFQCFVIISPEWRLLIKWKGRFKNAGGRQPMI